MTLLLLAGTGEAKRIAEAMADQGQSAREIMRVLG